MTDDDGTEMYEGFLHLAMTDTEHLVVTCPAPDCVWAGLLPTAWNPLVTAADVGEFCERHLKWAHPQVKNVEIGQVISQNRDATAQICLMRARTIAMRDHSCYVGELLKGNDASDGAVKYVLRQKAVNEGDTEGFDAWWAEVERHEREDHGQTSQFVDRLLALFKEYKDGES